MAKLETEQFEFLVELIKSVKSDMHSVDTKIDKIEDSSHSVEKSLGDRIDKIDHRFDSFEKSLGKRFDKTTERIDSLATSLTQKVDALNKNQITWRNGILVWWMLVTVLVSNLIPPLFRFFTRIA